MSVRCTRRIQFCAGHRVPLHSSKCRHPHGHNYVAFLTAEADELDEAGMVIDFGVLKEVVGGWVDKHWDHGTILQDTDREMRAAIMAFNRVSGLDPKVYYMHAAPTAENLAEELLARGAAALEGSRCSLVGVELWETENCCAYAGVPSR